MNVNDTLKKWLTGDYTRLSKEDGDKEESDSISNQKSLIQNYVNSHPEFLLVKHYSDDGYTGVNFERPGFQEMLEDIKSGKINCIIVKDLSRFGRNYIEVGRYIERIFPGLGIRFIAINDNYDSQHSNSSADQLLLPFKNLINDAYSRDISIKVRSNLEVKRKQGDYVSSAVPYGYKKAEDDKHLLVIDEPAANIVKLIFAKKIDGLSNHQIAHYLNQMKIPTPLMYKQANGINAKTSFQIHVNPEWSKDTVRRILENEIYTGTLIQGKTYRPNYKIRKSLARPKDDWYRKENVHEAIVSKEAFDIVQDICSADTRQVEEQETIHLFSGILYCSSCQQLCTRKMITSKSGTYIYYGCYLSGHKAGCKGHAINESYLERTILSILKQYIHDLTDMQQMISYLKELPSDELNTKALTQEIWQKEKDIKKYKRLIVSLYEDYHDGLLDKNEYLELKDVYHQQVLELTDVVETITFQRDELLDSFTSQSSRIDSFQEYLDTPVLSRKMLVSLVKCIYIYPKNRIHIIFRFPDEFEKLLHFLPDTLSKKLVSREVCS